jgi:hypothetical protein
MKKTLVIILCLISLTTMSFAFMDQKPRYQNLKVLPKNTSKEVLDSVMKHFTTALGVKCNFCHVRMNDEQRNWDFASDNNNHKRIAREMMKMTVKLNKKYFDVKLNKGFDTPLMVSCFTCHNGKPEPAVIPPAKSERKTTADSTGRQQ